MGGITLELDIARLMVKKVIDTVAITLIKSKKKKKPTTIMCDDGCLNQLPLNFFKASNDSDSHCSILFSAESQECYSRNG